MIQGSAYKATRKNGRKQTMMSSLNVGDGDMIAAIQDADEQYSVLERQYQDNLKS